MPTMMKVEFINPFVAATLHVFDTMFATRVKRGQPYLARPDLTHEGVTGVIGLSGEATGTIAICLSSKTAIQACERFLGTPVSQVDDDVVDCVGEVINMIAGNAKARMEQFRLSISLPSIIYGKDHNTQFPKEITPICVPFDSDIGDMLLMVGFVIKD